MSKITPFDKQKASAFRTFHPDLIDSSAEVLKLAFQDRRNYCEDKYNHLTAHGPAAIILMVTAFDVWLSEVVLIHVRFRGSNEQIEILVNKNIMDRYGKLYELLHPNGIPSHLDNLRIAVAVRHEIIHHFHGRPDPPWLSDLETRGLVMIHPYRTPKRVDSDFNLTMKLSSYALAYWVCETIEQCAMALVQATDNHSLDGFAKYFESYKSAPPPKDLPNYPPASFVD